MSVPLSVAANDDGRVTRAELIRALRLPANANLCEV
jgi:hypothetical protein